MSKKAAVYFVPVADQEALGSVAAKAARAAEAAKLGSVVAKGRPCAIKTHFGEGANEGYVKAPVVAALVAFVQRAGGDPFLTDTNTLYRGRRHQATDHLRQAAEHGFTLDAVGAPVVIADGLHGTDQAAVPIRGGKHFREVRIATALHQAASALVVTHVKGHCQFGLGGAIKNVGMGCAAGAGKMAQHQGGSPRFHPAKCLGCGVCAKWCPADAIEMRPGKADRNTAVLIPKKCIGCGECLALCPADAIGFEWLTDGPGLIERACEHALGFLATKPRGVGFVSFLMDVTQNCDCVGAKQPVLAPNVGILASTDLVAVDKAAADLSRARFGEDVWAKWWPDSQYESQFAYGAQLGLGTAEYELVAVA